MIDFFTFIKRLYFKSLPDFWYVACGMVCSTVPASIIFGSGFYKSEPVALCIFISVSVGLLLTFVGYILGIAVHMSIDNAIYKVSKIKKYIKNEWDEHIEEMERIRTNDTKSVSNGALSIANVGGELSLEEEYSDTKRSMGNKSDKEMLDEAINLLGYAVSCLQGDPENIGRYTQSKEWLRDRKKVIDGFYDLMEESNGQT